MNLQSKALNGEILKLSVPSILANITIPLVGIVDTAIVGHLGDLSAIGGIAIGTMLFDLLYWNFGFLRVSTAGMTAEIICPWATAAFSVSLPIRPYPTSAMRITYERAKLRQFCKLCKYLRKCCFFSSLLQRIALKNNKN